MDLLNLGAGNRIIPEAINHDRIVHRPVVDTRGDGVCCASGAR